MSEDRLTMAERHVREAERRIEQQKQLIARFRMLGSRDHAETAEAILGTFQKSLKLAHQGLRLQRAKLGLGPR